MTSDLERRIQDEEERAQLQQKLADLEQRLNTPATYAVTAYTTATSPEEAVRQVASAISSGRSVAYWTKLVPKDVKPSNSAVCFTHAQQLDFFSALTEK